MCALNRLCAALLFVVRGVSVDFVVFAIVLCVCTVVWHSAQRHRRDSYVASIVVVVCFRLCYYRFCCCVLVMLWCCGGGHWCGL